MHISLQTPFGPSPSVIVFSPYTIPWDLCCVLALEGGIVGLGQP